MGQFANRVALLVALAVLPAGPAMARRSATPPAPAREALVEEPRGAWSSAPPETRDCTRVRRKFWQPDQGWIVRSIVACR